MSTTITSPALRLEPITGPETGVIDVAAREGGAVLGRSAQCDIVLMDPEGVVSRRHCEFRRVPGGWTVADLRSRHGTWLNQEALVAEQPTQIHEGDRLRIGMWTFRVRIGDHSAAQRVHTMDDRGSALGQLQRFAPPVVAPDSQRRLELLMNCAAAVGTATEEGEIARAAVEALVMGCGFPRAAMVRAVGGAEEVEILALKDAVRGEGSARLAFSRSLIAASAEGQTVVLNSGDMPKYGQSIVSLGIASAVCTPVMLDGAADAYLYLDARAGERGQSAGVSQEVAAFCQAVSRLCGLALANLHRSRLELDRKRRHMELEAARDVQAIIMPPARGSHGRISYAMRSIPGRYVAGDLFDFVVIDENRAAVLLGDVVGKGVAAGMIMSNVQAHLSRLLRTVADPAEAVNEANAIVYEYSQRYNTEREGLSIFLSLMVAVVDARDSSVRWVDAGHGHWFIRAADGGASRPSDEGGPPVGVVPDMTYTSCRAVLGPGDRVVLFSDGVVEQRSASGEEFGAARASEVLRDSTTAATDADLLVDAVMRHAGATTLRGESPFADDVTVASVEIARG